MRRPNLIQVRFPIDVDEIVEACEILERWRGRGAELPPALRDQLEEVLGGGNRDRAAVRVVSGVVFADLSPHLRNLVANLRARETAETGLLEGSPWT